MNRRIALYIYALAPGGAERVMATLATGLAERGHEVTLLTDFAAPELAFLIGPGVRQVELGRNHAGAVARLAGFLRRERPDVSISATGVSNLKHAAAALAAGRAHRAVMSFHGHIESEGGRLSWAGNALAPVLTRLTARSVFVSDDVMADFLRRGASRRRAIRIYNPVPAAAAGYADGSRPGAPHLLAVGRLVPLKGYDTLLKALAKLGRPDLRLTILGEGPERGALQAEIRRLGLDSQVELPGWAGDPAPYYARASLFVLASRRESFANVVVEALAHGLPVVATDCGGPREILQDGRFGRLVPVDDPDAMAQAIAESLADPGDPASRRARAADFAPETSLAAYEALIEGVIAARR